MNSSTLPLISANDNWNVRRQQLRSQALSGLPAYATSMNMGFAPFERTSSPWKHHINRASAMKHYDKLADDDEARMSTKQFSDPHSVILARCFRTSSVLRQVPIMRRHLDTFGGRLFSIPMKTKPVPVHTGRFLYDPMCPPTIANKLSQNERLAAEIEMMKKVRGQKRKREAIEHRWGWRNFDLSGIEVARNERYSIHAEVQKLKELVLPPAAREIYTGRGIRLPSTHQTYNPPKAGRPSTEGVAGPSESNIRRRGFPSLRAPASSSEHVTNPTSSAAAIPKSTTQYTPADLQSQQTKPSTTLLVQSVPAPGTLVTSSPTNVDEKENEKEHSDTQGNKQETPKPGSGRPTPMNVPQTVRMHEPVEKIEVVDPDVEDEEARAKSDLTMIPETPIERPRSLAAPSASPETSAPNPVFQLTENQATPLISKAVQTLLKQQFEEISKEREVTFDDILNLSSENLTTNQKKYLLCLHDVSARNTAFVFQELIAYTCLSRIVQNLNPSTAEMFEQCNFATLPESIVQYTELFNSVDRSGRGQIGVNALLEILNTTLHRQITTDERLLSQVLKTIDKEKEEQISKLEFLAFIPYFTHLEELS